MIYNVKSLRDKTNLSNVEKSPGYYKWWARKTEFIRILSALNLSYDEVIRDIEECKIDGEIYYCIYIGVAIKESIAARLNWHINQKNTLSQVRNGTLSTLRRSIAAVICGNMLDTSGTNNFLDLLMVETFPLNLQIKSQEAKEKIQAIERKLLEGKNLYVLNIQENKHASAPVKELKAIRKAVASKIVL